MARSLNKVQLIGNLGADPEIRFTQDGRPIANLRIATSDSWKDAQGQPQERTEWHRVVIFGKLAEIAQQYLRKGSKAYIEGQLQTRKWTDNQNQERYTTEIVVSQFNSQLLLLDSRQNTGYAPPVAGSGGYGGASGYNAPMADPYASQEYRSPSPPTPPPVAGRTYPPMGPASGGPPPLDEFAQAPAFDDDIPF